LRQQQKEEAKEAEAQGIEGEVPPRIKVRSEEEEEEKMEAEAPAAEEEEREAEASAPGIKGKKTKGGHKGRLDRPPLQERLLPPPTPTMMKPSAKASKPDPQGWW
jgi:hypothetical protein